MSVFSEKAIAQSLNAEWPMTLEPAQLHLLSAMMQTLGALWGIVFVVYVFLFEYYSRPRGGWQDLARKTIDRLRHEIEWAPTEIESYSQGGRTSPPITRRLKDELDSVPYTRGALRRYRRVFWQILVTGPIVLASILVNVFVLALNDADLMSIAVGLFVLALLSLAIVLLKEVWTGISRNAHLGRTLRETEVKGQETYEEARKTIREE